MTLDEARVAAAMWREGALLVDLEEQLEILAQYSDDARAWLLAILSDEGMWRRICALGDDRLRRSFGKYGDRSFRKMREQLAQDLLEELADARAYAALSLWKKSS